MNSTNYQTVAPPAPHVQKAFEAVKKFYGLQPGLLSVEPRLLDAGCGEGRHACYLASLGYHVLGIDADDRMIQEALRRTPQTYSDQGLVRYFQKDVGGLHFGTEFDGVLCNETLQLLPPTKRQSVVRKLMQITRPGGFHLVSSYVAPAGSAGSSVWPLLPGSLRSVYKEAGWDVIHAQEDPYEEVAFGSSLAITSLAVVVAIKP